MSSRWMRAGGAALVTTALVMVAACGGSSQPGSADAAGGKAVTIEFWSWADGYQKSVDLWNKAHPDVQVKFSRISPGSVGGYAKMQNAVKAGNAPCLGQISFDTIPTFVAAGALADITKYAQASKDQFVPWAWQQSSIGDQVYGIPVGIGPQALFYRSDLFKKYGISPPKTWDEFALAAQKVHTANPAAYLTTIPQDSYDLGALTWQAGGRWFGTSNDQWQVTIDNPQTQKVAKYWQDQLTAKTVSSTPPLDTAWFKDVQDGRVLSYVGAVWAAPLITANLPKLAGKWAVAPMPQWTADGKSFGNRGGSATVALKGCKHLQQATEFATWFSTNADSVTHLVESGGVYPAASSLRDLPAMTKPSAYFGGQNIFEVFKNASDNISPSWVWGPTMVQTQSDFKAALKKAGAGQNTVLQAVTDVQASTVAALKSQGLNVEG